MIFVHKYMNVYGVNSFIILGMNYKYMYRVSLLMLITRFTLNIISGIELLAMYKVNTFNLRDSTCNY